MARDGNAKGMKETKFKDTELGKIPEEWEVCKVLDFTDVMTGATPSTENPDYWDGHILWMSSGELNKKFVYDVAGRITKKGYNSASTHMLPKNCVLIGLAGQGKTRGTAAINKIELCTNQSIGAILPSSDTDADYLFYFFDSQYQNLRALSSGDGGRGGLSKGLLLNYDVIRPHDKAEQQRIASALSDADALVAELDALIEKKRAIMAGTMQELLTGKRRLQGFSEPWVERTIEDFAKITTGASNTQDQAPFGIFPFYIRSASVMKSNRFLYDCEGVITIGDGQIGKVFHYVNGKFDLHQRCYLIYDFYDVDAKFFYYIFSAFFYERAIALSAKATVDSVRRDMIAKMKVDLPSLAEQRAIASILSDMDAEIAELEAKRDKYKEVRQGMMQQLLTGKIRLI
jgi:type I restriction enzyme, S subunit